MRSGSLYAIALLIAAAGAVYVLRKGAALATTAGNALNAINPLNDSNLFAQGADAVVKGLSGGAALSLGDAIYHAFNPDDAGKNAIAPVIFAQPATTRYDPATADAEDAGMFNPGFIDNTGGAAVGRVWMKP